MCQGAQDEARCSDRWVPAGVYTRAFAETKLTIFLGDRIVVVVQKQRSFGPESGSGGSVSIAAANKVRRGDIRHAVVVRTAKKYQRPDGSAVRFDDNACVLINKTGEPIGSRLNSKHLQRQKRCPVHGLLIPKLAQASSEQSCGTDSGLKYYL